MPQLECQRCGAPRDARFPFRPCAYCGAPPPPFEGAAPASTVLAVGFYDERLPGWSRDTTKAEFHVEPARGTLRLSLPPSQTTVPLLSTEAQGDDVELAVSIRVVQGLVFEPGKMGVGVGLELRSSAAGSYDIAMTPSGVFSLSRYAGRQLAEWLLEPKSHSALVEGLGHTARLVLVLRGDRIQIVINDTLVAQVRDASLKRGTFGFNLRPGDAPATIELSDVHVTSVV